MFKIDTILIKSLFQHQDEDEDDDVFVEEPPPPTPSTTTTTTTTTTTVANNVGMNNNNNSPASTPKTNSRSTSFFAQPGTLAGIVFVLKTFFHYFLNETS